MTTSQQYNARVAYKHTDEDLQKNIERMSEDAIDRDHNPLKYFRKSKHYDPVNDEVFFVIDGSDQPFSNDDLQGHKTEDISHLATL